MRGYTEHTYIHVALVTRSRNTRETDGNKNKRFFLCRDFTKSLGHYLCKRASSSGTNNQCSFLS